MESGTLHAVAAPTPPAPGITIPTQRRSRDYLSAHGSTPDEPVAVVVAGAAANRTSALVGALLGAPGDEVAVPAGSYLVIRYGQSGMISAHVPGCREPQPYRPAPADGAGSGIGTAELTRPPRRVELELPHSLLRHFTLINTPCARDLGVAGARVLADAAARGGAVVFVVAPDRSLGNAELDLLAELGAREIAVFFAVTPPLDTPEPVPSDQTSAPEPGPDMAPDPVATALTRHQAAVAARVPFLAVAPWLAVDPDAGDIAYLRRTLIEWAGVEGLHRAGDNPEADAGVPSAVRVAAAAADSGWPGALDEWLLTTGREVRQRLTVELANIHLRCVQEILFGGGRAGVPHALDQELHALSLRATAESDTAAANAVETVLRLVLAGEPTDGVRRRVDAALRLGLGDDPATPDFTRVLLVTRTCGVASIAGEEAVAALPAYRTGRPAVLPPVAIGLSGGCYALWRQPAAALDDPDEAGDGNARSWLQRVVRAVEHELLAEMDRRFEAIHRSLGALITESVDHGILLV